MTRLSWFCVQLIETAPSEPDVGDITFAGLAEKEPMCAFKQACGRDFEPYCVTIDDQFARGNGTARVIRLFDRSVGLPTCTGALPSSNIMALVICVAIA